MGLFGESDKSKALKNLSNLTNQFYNEVGGLDLNKTANETSFNPLYGVEDQRAVLDRLSGLNKQNLKNTTMQNAFNQKRAIQQRMSAGGVNPLSTVANSMYNDVNANANQNYLTQNTNYDIARQGQDLGLMENANQDKWKQRQFAVQNLLQKYGLKSGALNSLGGVASQQDDTTAWDDILSGLQAAGSVGGAVAKFL